MPSDRSVQWVGIAWVVSLFLSAFAWLYFPNLVPLLTFIAGAFFALWTQERLEKKRRIREREIKMTEHIYGPLLKELRAISANLKNSLSPSDAFLETLIGDYRFSLVEEELGSRIKKFQARLLPYASFLDEAYRETEVHIGRGLDKHGIKGEVKFVIWAGRQEIFNFPMIEPIFRDKPPLEFLTERAEPYRNTSMIVYTGRPSESEGYFSSEHRLHQISMEILMEVRKDPLVQEQRRQKEELLKECSSLIESIKEKIVL